MGRRIGLAFCAVGGASIVSFYDLGFNDRQSLIMKTAEIVRIYFFKSWDTSAWAGLFVVILVAFFLGFVRKPKTTWSATEIGLGVIAFIATLMSPLKQESISKHVAVTQLQAEAYADGNSFSNETGEIIINVENETQKPVHVQIRDAESDQILHTATENTNHPITIGNIDKTKDYLVYIEEQGKKWTKFQVNSHDQDKLLKVKTENSNLPMLFQRFIGPREPTSLQVLPINKAEKNND